MIFQSVGSCRQYSAAPGDLTFTHAVARGTKDFRPVSLEPSEERDFYRNKIRLLPYPLHVRLMFPKDKGPDLPTKDENPASSYRGSLG